MGRRGIGPDALAALHGTSLVELYRRPSYAIHGPPPPYFKATLNAFVAVDCEHYRDRDLNPRQYVAGAPAASALASNSVVDSLPPLVSILVIVIPIFVIVSPSTPSSRQVPPKGLIRWRQHIACCPSSHVSMSDSSAGALAAGSTPALRRPLAIPSLILLFWPSQPDQWRILRTRRGWTRPLATRHRSLLYSLQHHDIPPHRLSPRVLSRPRPRVTHASHSHILANFITHHLCRTSGQRFTTAISPCAPLSPPMN